MDHAHVEDAGAIVGTADGTGDAHAPSTDESSDPPHPSGLDRAADILYANTRPLRHRSSERSPGRDTYNQLDELGHHMDSRALPLGSETPKQANVQGDESDTEDEWAEDVDVETAEDAITRHRDVLAAASQNQIPPSELASHMLSLARALRSRYAVTGKQEYLDERVVLYRHLSSMSFAEDEIVERANRGLGWVLCERHRRTGAVDAIQESVRCHSLALDRCPTDYAHRAACLDGLGAALAMRYHTLMEEDDITRALACHREALRLAEDSGCLPRRSLRYLAIALLTRCSVTGNMNDVEESEVFLRRALTYRTTALDLALLSRSLRFRLRVSGKQADLDESIQSARDAVEACRPESPHRAFCVGTLAASLWYSFVRLGASADIEESISLCDQAREISQAGPEHAVITSLLTVVLQSRFTRFGEMADLDRAIILQRGLLAADTAGSSRSRRMVLGNLANTLINRFHQLGHLADLEEAVALKRASVDGTKADTHRLANLVGLGGMLKDLYDQTQKLNTLGESIEVLHEAVGEAERKGHILLCSSLINLAEALLRRHTCFENDGDLEDALRSYLQALSLCNEGHTSRHMCLDGLSTTYRTKFERHGREEDARLAMEHQAEALSLAAPGHAARSQCLFNMAHLFLMRGTSYYSLTEACKHTSEGVLDNSSNAQRRLSAAMEVLAAMEERISGEMLGDQNQQDLLNVYSQTMRLLPRVAYFGLDVNSRLRVLGKAPNLATSAAIHALALGGHRTALEILEEGRGVFWTQALRLRTPLDELPPAISDKLAQLLRQLEGAGASKVLEEEAARKRRLSEEFESALYDIRMLPGYERFMLHDTFASLTRSADCGVIVTLISGNPCHALILRSAGDGLEHIKLPGVSINELKHLRLTMKHARHEEAGSDRSIRVTAAGGDKNTNVLAKLWATVVRPVLMALKYDRCTGRDRPRLFWMPTGAFTFLPLHAAGVYQERGSIKVECCSDYVVSSYTPTLSVLLHARRPQAIARGAPSVFLAAATHPPSWKPLLHAESEVNIIKDIVPKDAIIPLLANDSPKNADVGVTLKTVLEKLPEASIFHVACHGKQDAGNALDSGFIFQDGTLTVAQLMSLNLPRAFLAFLSACETAKGDEAQPDQAVHLAAAMLFVGFRSVVGTMWSMGDPDGPLVAKIVYEAIFKEGKIDFDVVPYALDAAVRELRAKKVPPNRWATYIHMGA